MTLVRVIDNRQQVIELPTEVNGFLSEQTLQAVFPGKSILLYKKPGNHNFSCLLPNGNGRIEPPEDGWQERIYYCEVPERNSINNDSSRICSKIFGVSPILFLLVFIILKYFKCLIDRKENEENNCSISDIMNSVNIFTAFATFTITFYHYCSGWLEEKCKF